MKVKRKHIPKSVKEHVIHRDKRQCVCCLEKRNLIFHHIHPVSLDCDQLNHKNIVLLCQHHHDLLHLGDLQTILTVSEYLYYLKYNQLPDSCGQLEEIMTEYFAGKY